MAATQAPEPELKKPTSEKTKVFGWRLEVLKRAGYDFEAAWLIAGSGADLHEACALLAGGCTVPTALLILL